MARGWGFDYEETYNKLYNKSRDKIFPFNSKKKRSTAVVHRADGSVRLYCKGAPEWVLQDCVSYTNQRGEEAVLTPVARQALEDHIKGMAHRALRTLCIAHRDFHSANDLPKNWQEVPPDSSDLVCDAIVGIIDPLREDVKEAVARAQAAGVTVRMVTGDNINTACAIARQCGILTEGGIALEGPQFRNMTPNEVDAILPRLQVLARSSPDDKFLLVTRLNGHGMPATKEEWEEKHPRFSWEKDRDRLLPGYKQEWEATRPDGGQVVGVTGDGINDAPALKAADVGLSMGITGTRVAKDASDIVILDDKFSSIVRAIMWGRSVYDNIRKFLQFQLTVNVVACGIVFLAAVAGFTPPLNAVMMLWVNLIMDTMGALALGTEKPTPALLDRKPYKRSAFMLSRPMIRHIACQATFQLVLLLVLLFAGAKFFNVEPGSVKHNTIIFNTFVFCQVFNELNARSLTDEWAVCKNLHHSPVLLIINIITIAFQIVIVELGGPFTKTTGLSLDEWLITVALGMVALPIGVLMRYIPVTEDPNSFFQGEPLLDKNTEHKSEGNEYQMTTLGKEIDLA
jgi:magnesium-transporting ATPase (P-type)